MPDVIPDPVASSGPSLSLARLAIVMLSASIMIGFVSGQMRNERQAKPQATAVAPLASSGVAPVQFLTNPPGMVDREVRLEDADAFAEGTAQRVRLVTAGGPARVTLDDPREKAFPRQGTWTTPQVEAELPFTEFLPSWNADVPPDCGVAFDVRVRDHATRQWSPWIWIGSWGRVVPSPDRLRKFDGGRVDVDNLQLVRPCDAFQMRVDFDSYALDPQRVPSLRRLCMIYSGLAPEAERAKWLTPVVATRGGWDRSLPVPYRTQKDAPKQLSYQLCSPTSTSMVLQYWGVDRPTIENALAIYDADNEMFGNWNRAVQLAGSLGLDAWLERFRTWDAVKARIAEGQPVVASIKFKKGEFPSAILTSSLGHLIVIRGFTPAGDVICNDPAKPDKGNGVVYKANELAHAWFDHGGVGYVIRGKGPPPASTQPTTRSVVIGR